MFRSRKSGQTKRLWKLRTIYNEADRSIETPEELELKSLCQSLLKRLHEDQLDVLAQAIESKGGETTECLHLPKRELKLGRRTVSPLVLCCQIWRWPDLRHDHELKKLTCCCTPSGEPDSICCNPYHWSRLMQPESPPPAYSLQFLPNKSDDEESPPSLHSSTETAGFPTDLQLVTDSTGAHSKPYWCNVAYWELRQRVGRLFTVFDDSMHIFQDLPHGNGLCLSVLQKEPETAAVRRTREKIGLGLTLSREADGVWCYNRSEYPIFVNSPTLEPPNSRTCIVRKIKPGYSCNVFDYEKMAEVRKLSEHDPTDGPYDPNAVRISFAKGWGPCYTRQILTCCPCWLEILLKTNR